MTNRGFGLYALALALATSAPAQDHLVGAAPGSPGPGGSGAPARSYGEGAPVSRGRLFAKAKMHHTKAGMEKRQGNLGGAAAELRKILELPFPEDVESRKLQASVSLNLADLLRQMRRWDEAEKVAARGLGYLRHESVPPTHYEAELLELHADLLDMLGRPEEAEAARRRYFQVWERLDAQGQSR